MTPEFEIAKLELREGDTLVIRLQGRFNDEARAKIAGCAKQAVPEGVKCMVIDDSVELSVLEKI